MKNKLLYVILAALTMSGCITEYTPPHIDGMGNLLVVEGMICDGETVIKLSRSVSLDPDDDAIYNGAVYGARVWIEGENGDIWASSGGQTPGEYPFEVGELENDVRYRLRIVTPDGEEYESEYRYPQQTPPIRAITFGQRSDGEPLQVRLDVVGTEDGARHYLWSYNEIWEVRAYFRATHYLGYEDDYYNYFSYGYVTYNLERSFIDFIQKYPDNMSPLYYGWKYSNSRSLLLGSTEKLSRNELKDYVLYEIGLSDDRLSELYYTTITQYALGDEAYYYFENQKKNTDDTGTIFSPIPSEMRGNIVCTTSPDVPVIGYVEVSRRAEKEIYLHSGDAPYDRPWDDCPTVSMLDIGFEPEKYFPSEMYLFTYPDVMHPDADKPWTYARCIDCRQAGGTKNRPAFWPNDHY